MARPIDKLRAYLKANPSLRKVDFAARVGVSKATLNNWLLRDNIPPRDHRAVAAAMGKSVDWLLDPNETPIPAMPTDAARSASVLSLAGTLIGSKFDQLDEVWQETVRATIETGLAAQARAEGAARFSRAKSSSSVTPTPPTSGRSVRTKKSAVKLS